MMKDEKLKDETMNSSRGKVQFTKIIISIE